MEVEALKLLLRNGKGFSSLAVGTRSPDKTASQHVLSCCLPCATSFKRREGLAAIGRDLADGKHIGFRQTLNGSVWGIGQSPFHPVCETGYPTSESLYSEVGRICKTGDGSDQFKMKWQWI